MHLRSPPGIFADSDLLRANVLETASRFFATLHQLRSFRPAARRRFDDLPIGLYGNSMLAGCSWSVVSGHHPIEFSSSAGPKCSDATHLSTSLLRPPKLMLFADPQWLRSSVRTGRTQDCCANVLMTTLRRITVPSSAFMRSRSSVGESSDPRLRTDWSNLRQTHYGLLLLLPVLHCLLPMQTSGTSRTAHRLTSF